VKSLLTSTSMAIRLRLSVRCFGRRLDGPNEELAEEVFGPLGLLIRRKVRRADAGGGRKFQRVQLTTTLQNDDGDIDLARPRFCLCLEQMPTGASKCFPTVSSGDTMAMADLIPASTNFGRICRHPFDSRFLLPLLPKTCRRRCCLPILGQIDKERTDNPPSLIRRADPNFWSDFTPYADAARLNRGLRPFMNEYGQYV